MATTNKLTPRLKTVKVPGADWISLDIGLWPGATGHNQLTAMAYHQADGWRPPVASLAEWESVLSEVRNLWASFSCPRCDGRGCDSCANSGWKDYVRWRDGGEKLNSDNYPVF